MVAKQGIDSEKSIKSIYMIWRSIITPTRNSALVVAAEGIIRKMGEKNNDRKNNTATVNAVSPVRPPAAIPELLQ